MAIKTLSIPTELDLFLSENPDLSPSKMLQSKIIEIQESRRISQEEKLRSEKAYKHLQNRLWKANDEIDHLQKIISKLKGKQVPLDDGKNVKLV